jgi:hypothetical protein
MTRRLLLFGFLLAVTFGAAGATRDNDDSCDISVLPAATLLLPYFEVDLDDQAGPTTRFSVTNVTNVDRVVHVTLWTDRAYPVIGFNVYLTGYDMQVVDLFDVLERGIIAPPSGTGAAVGPRGRLSRENPALDRSDCTRLPGALPAEYVVRMREAFTLGRVPALGSLAGCDAIGGAHANAIGYATIDVVGSCTDATVQQSDYWTRDLRYDNVLTGDYELVDASRGAAQGGPLVHVRAVPEGGTPELRRAAPVTFDAGFERTFYGRQQPANAPRLDGRQPLPSQFAPRWIQGGPAELRTSMKIWRESAVRADAPCAAFAANDDLPATDIVRFDENENAAGPVPVSRPIVVEPEKSRLDATSITSVSDASVYPQLTNGATGGWFALNLDVAPGDTAVTQSWVISSMSAQGRFSTDTEAPAFGNGCSPQARISEIASIGGAPIAPARNVNRNARTGQASTNNDDSCDIALLPAATLLLPLFRVDLEPARTATTLLSVTNVSPEERIARVTLWTDYAFPVITFNVFLTGYDVQSIDLYDVIARGLIAPEHGTGTAVSRRGRWSRSNPDLSLGACERLPGALGEEWVEWMQSAFLDGEVPDFGLREGCGEAGRIHSPAIGYATIDVVRNCASAGPAEPSYWSRDLAFDNVLIGDYQLVSHADGAADGAPMVHIRAIPEGGTSAERRADPAAYDARFPRTFYSRFQSPERPGFDARQPLPSTFAARWSTGTAETIFEIWREGATSDTVDCGRNQLNEMEYVEVVRFDDSENAAGSRSTPPSPALILSTLPATSRTHIQDAGIFPFLTNGATSGWVYFNLDRGDDRAAQAWMVATQFVRGQHALRRDAAALGNGCSPPPVLSEATNGNAVIGPAPNRNRP